MRLLHVEELEVKEFNDLNRPQYAILSHTWGDGEVSFQDIQTPQAKSMAGYAKVQKCCEIAKQDGFEYVWIDTCCINKTSSTELSEAINSMFQWYKDASVCYVYLSDLKDTPTRDNDAYLTLWKCRWFRRGWTLQELLAPEIVVFYQQDWVDIGTKRNLKQIISVITHIPPEALLDVNLVPGFSVAARMSWAARRETTRMEDRAYSLMGIFGINMPLLYGEGDNAFRRLQLEIIKVSSDESIFAWSEPEDPDLDLRSPDSKDLMPNYQELLARSPASFYRCGDICRTKLYPPVPPFSMSNRGLNIWLPAIKMQYKTGDVFLVGLNCTVDGARIFLALAHQNGLHDYLRSSSETYCIDEASNSLDNLDDPSEFYIAQGRLRPFNSAIGSSASRLDDPEREIKFYFAENTSPETGYHLDLMCDGKFSYGKELPGRARNFNTDRDFRRNFYVIYIVVKSIRDPSVYAIVALGASRNVLGETTYHCRVFGGKVIPSILDKFIDLASTKDRKYYFSKIFPGTGCQFFPNDKIVRKGLENGHVIAIAIRRGAVSVDELPYHVVIELNNSSWSEYPGILDVDDEKFGGSPYVSEIGHSDEEDSRGSSNDRRNKRSGKESMSDGRTDRTRTTHRDSRRRH